MKLLLLLTVTILSGCEATQQLAHKAYDYRYEHQSYSGDFDANHYNQSTVICANKTDMYGAEIEARQKAADNQNSDYDCYGTDSGSNVRMNCTSKSSNNTYDSNLWTLGSMNRNNERKSLMKKYHQTCMAEHGYKLVRVCFRNCTKKP